MPHCPDCGLWVHQADPSCLACDAELTPLSGEGEYDEGAGLMGDEVTRGRLHTELGIAEFGTSYATKRGFRPIIIGTLMLAFAWLILPFFALLGYASTMGRYAAQGRNEPPEMIDLTSYLGDGLRVVLSTIVTFWLPGVVYLYLANYYLVEPTHILIFLDREFLITTDPVGVVAVYLVGFILLVIWPAILTLYIGYGSLAKTYNPKNVSRYIRSSFYIKSVGAVFMLSAIFGLIVGVMATIITGIDFYLDIGTNPTGLVGAVLAIFPLFGAIFAVAFGTMVIFATLGYIYFHAGEAVVVERSER